MSQIKRFILTIILTLISSGFLYSQKENYSVVAGVTYGGPIPINNISNSSGTPKISPLLGLQATYKLHNRIYLNIQLDYAYKSVDYTSNYRKDTLISQVVNNVTVKVPSFYTAYVNGNIGLHYLELHLSPTYKISEKISMMGGMYCSYLLGGFDKGNVQVVIGEGGFYGDYFESFNNIKSISKLDLGISLGMKSYWYKKIFSGFMITRSIRNLYSEDIFSKRSISTNKLYNTYVYVYLGFDI